MRPIHFSPRPFRRLVSIGIEPDLVALAVADHVLRFRGDGLGTRRRLPADGDEGSRSATISSEGEREQGTRRGAPASPCGAVTGRSIEPARCPAILGAARAVLTRQTVPERCEGSPRARRLRTIVVAYVSNKERSGGR
jgi:hypothetical protein